MKLRYVHQNRVGAACAAKVREGRSVPQHDAFQLRSWAPMPEDAVLSLEEIARRILGQEPEPDSGAQI